MSITKSRGAGLLLGLGFALLPTLGPFLGLLLLISTRLRVNRLDLFWGGAALCFSLAPLLTGNLDLLFQGVFQLAAGWLIYRAFAESRAFVSSVSRSMFTELGLVTGLALVVAFSLFQVEAWNFSSAKTIAQAIVWQSSPALFAHTVLALGSLIAVLTTTRAIRLVALLLMAFGILISGSREAAIAWVLVSTVVVYSGYDQRWRSRLVEIGVLIIMVAVSAGLGPSLGWGNVGYLLQPVNRGASVNMFQGTELASGDWWDASWVDVSPSNVVLGGRELTSYLVRKNGEEGWLRLQQAVEIQPESVYTLSAWIQTPDGAEVPGFQGWGRYHEPTTDTTEHFVVAGELRNGAWSATARGSGAILDSGIAETDGEWSRAYVTFAYSGPEAIHWFVGLAPDARSVANTDGRFAAFQIESGVLGPYEPGTASRGLPLGVARLPYWQAAWQGIVEKPILGWGSEDFSDYFAENWPDQARTQVVPAHSHNAFLQAWFERGVFGLIGLLLFIGVLAAPAALRGDWALLTVLSAIIFVNVFDTTLTYGGVFYPLVAVAGWRAASMSTPSSSSATKAAAVNVASRFGLALADAAAALVSATLGYAIVTWASPILGLELAKIHIPRAAMYGLLLWPALSWREGLYPGYGLTPQQELKKLFVVATYAVLLLAAALFVAGDLAVLPLPVLFAAYGMSVVALPAGRSLAKRMLYEFGLWGRPIIILGAGQMGERIATALKRTPLDGLQPVAFFDDDPTLWNREFAGIRVHGPLAEAEPFAETHHVQHAIVAIPSIRSSPSTTNLLDRWGKRFRTVQYVPDLPGIPIEDVGASSLDGMLALEVRNNLALKRNRFAKRVIDLVGTILGGLLTSPLLIALAVAVRVDSPGPIFFGHERLGRDGRTFKTWKFRTMIHDAEMVLEDYLIRRPELRREWEESHKLENDPRVTRVGRFLRRSSLDELPQLLNVLLGQMSLVGPRPIVRAEVEKYEGAFEVYASVRPGITGFWQVSGRSDTRYRERVELDTYYVRNWSVWLDIVILVRTFRVVFKGSGAY